MKYFFLILISCLFFSCEKETESTSPNLIVKFKFDPTQVRLNNIGQPANIPTGNAGQTPVFNSISAHYFELTPNMYTQLGDGAVLYHAPETMAGGTTAIDFSQAKIVSENEAFLTIPLDQVTPGIYEWVRVSLSYQNFSVNLLHNNQNYTATLESFVGYNTYLTSHNIGQNIFPVNGNRAQGYWAFALNNFPYATSGQAPAGATTVPNPLFASSPIPQGSCVVTGDFNSPLQINGNETKDIEITLSLSVNNSFEWTEVNTDGLYEPSAGEHVVDMGLRGLKPSFIK